MVLSSGRRCMLNVIVYLSAVYFLNLDLLLVFDINIILLFSQFQCVISQMKLDTFLNKVIISFKTATPILGTVLKEITV